MSIRRLPTRAVLLLALSTAAAQQSTAPDAKVPAPAPRHPTAKPRTTHADQTPFNPNVILIDPAHGGPDSGARLGANVAEKDVTVAFAARLRTLLAGRGFTVILTHESAEDDTSLDARVETANHSRALACLILHASNGGHGVHLLTSSLPAERLVGYDPGEQQRIIPWDSAQSSQIAQSLRLEAELATAINGVRVPLVSGLASIRPIDSFACPSVVVELAPLNEAGASTPVDDQTYQRTVAEAVTTALTFWRSHALAQAMSAEISRAADAARSADEHSTPAATAAPKPRPKPRPTAPPAGFPDEAPPDSPASTARKPAPIVRHPPPPPPAQNPAQSQAQNPGGQT